MKKFILISLIILLVFGCTKVVEEKKPIKIALNQWPGYAVAFIAKEKGFFEKEYSKSQERYKNSEVDGVFEVFTDTIFHNSEGIKTKVVYVADHSTEGDVIIGKPEFNSLADLKGKKIGVDGINSFSHLKSAKELNSGFPMIT